MQLNRPTITVVIPAYNRKATICYCLESVLRQTVSPFEIIVVDDCSTDNTVDIVKSFSDPRIRCITLDENSGAQVARNRGIKEAQGEWIAFLDSDDAWVPNKLERQLEALNLVNFSPMVVVHSDCWRYDVDKEKQEICYLPLVDGEKPFALLLSAIGPMFQGILTSKAALEKIGLLDESVPSYQEWDTSIRLARECHFIHIREPLFIYYLHCGDTISKNKMRDIEGYQYVVDKFRDEIVRYCGKGTLNKHLIANAIRAKRYGLDAESLKILEKNCRRSIAIVTIKWMLQKGINPRYYEQFMAYFRRFRFIKSCN